MLQLLYNLAADRRQIRTFGQVNIGLTAILGPHLDDTTRRRPAYLAPYLDRRNTNLPIDAERPGNSVRPPVAPRQQLAFRCARSLCRREMRSQLRFARARFPFLIMEAKIETPRLHLP